MADWRDDASCRYEDPELFFPVGTTGPSYEKQVAMALSVCSGCPVLATCLEWALMKQPDGIAGGMTEQERARLNRHVNGTSLISA